MSYMNQTSRFSNVSDLIMYVCEQPRPLALDFEPVCHFPYVNKGWLGSLGLSDSEGASPVVLKPSENYDTTLFSTDIVFNDCSQTMADAIGTPYAVKCAVYCLLSFIPTVLSCFFLRTMMASKKAKSKGKATLNMSEKMCILNIFIGLMHCIILIDIDSYSGFMHIEDSRPLFLGFCGGSMYHIQVMLVTNWVGIIDAAMSKKKPAWSENFGLFTIVTCYIAEIIGGYLEVSACGTFPSFPPKSNSFNNARLSFTQEKQHTWKRRPTGTCEPPSTPGLPF